MAVLRADKPAMFLDFDGTLAEIRPRPELARLSAARRNSLRRLAERIPVAVVSGRPLDELERLIGLDDLILAGNHGLAIRTPAGRWTPPRAAGARPRLERFLARAEAGLADVPRAFAEDKGLTASLHVRLSPPGSQARVARLAAEAAAGLDRWLEIRSGKKVVEVRPRLDWDKGRAVRRILAGLEAGSTPIYIGDDRTDEDAFLALAGRGLTARVGRRGPSAAGFRLDGVDDVWRILRALTRAAAVRPGPVTAGRRLEPGSGRAG